MAHIIMEYIYSKNNLLNNLFDNFGSKLSKHEKKLFLRFCVACESLCYSLMTFNTARNMLIILRSFKQFQTPEI